MSKLKRLGFVGLVVVCVIGCGEEPPAPKMKAQPAVPGVQQEDKQEPGKQVSRPQMGEDTIHEMIKRGDVPVLRQAITEGVDVNARTLDEHEYTPLMFAAGAGQVEIVQLLLENGATVNLAGSEAKTSLHWAAQAGNPEVISLLLEAGADPKAVDRAGRNAYDWAKLANKDEAMLMLKEWETSGSEVQAASQAVSPASAEQVQAATQETTE